MNRKIIDRCAHCRINGSHRVCSFPLVSTNNEDQIADAVAQTVQAAMQQNSGCSDLHPTAYPDTLSYLYTRTPTRSGPNVPQQPIVQPQTLQCG